MLFGIPLVYIVLAQVIVWVDYFVVTVPAVFIALILFMFICLEIPILKLIIKQCRKRKTYLSCVYFILVIMLIFVISFSFTDRLPDFNHLIEDYALPFDFDDVRLN